MGDENKGEVIVGEVTVVTTAPEDVAIPDWLAKRDIFANGAKPGPTSYAPFVPKKDGKKKDDPTEAMKRVALYDINFLGRQFADSVYYARKDGGSGDFVTEDVTDKKGVTKAVPKRFIARGVGKALAKKLLAAQEGVYREFARMRVGSGLPVGEAEFDRWCSLRGVSGGYDFRNGSHFGGSAIDVNAASSPYVATRTFKGATAPDGKLGGEDFTKGPSTSKSGKALAKITPGLLADLVWRPAIEVYDRAMAFVYGDGKKADVSHYRTDNPGESHVEMDARFQTVSGALSQYFGFAYDLRSKTPKSLLGDEQHTPVSLDEFKARFRHAWEDEPAAPDSFQKLHSLWAGPMGAGQDAFLAALYKRIVDDHEAVRPAMVHGTLEFERDDSDPAPGEPTRVVFPSGGTRDPCYGFLDIRSEIVIALCDIEGIRWGGCMFGEGSNGDMMHFDLGYKNYPDLEPDPNPDNLGYVKAANSPPLGK